MAPHDLVVCLVAACCYCWRTLSMFDYLKQAHGFDHTIQDNLQSVWQYAGI